MIDPLPSIDSQNTLHNPFGFTGYQCDSVTNLWFAQARYYDAGMGRFISKDTHWCADNRIHGDINRFLPDNFAVRQSANLYAYCMNDPMQFFDPVGKAAIWLNNSTALPELGTPGHTGLLIQDANGQWWHWYWSKGGEAVSLVRYDGRLDLESINNSGIYNGIYDGYVFVEGDFSAGYDYLIQQRDTGKYSLLTMNCVQTSATAMSLGTPIRYQEEMYYNWAMPSVSWERFWNRMLYNHNNPNVITEKLEKATQKLSAGAVAETSATESCWT